MVRQPSPRPGPRRRKPNGRVPAPRHNGGPSAPDLPPPVENGSPPASQPVPTDSMRGGGRSRREMSLFPIGYLAEGGLAISGQGVTISPLETKALFRHWQRCLPRFVRQEIDSAEGAADLLEKAFVLATFQA